MPLLPNYQKQVNCLNCLSLLVYGQIYVLKSFSLYKQFKKSIAIQTAAFFILEMLSLDAHKLLEEMRKVQ